MVFPKKQAGLSFVGWMILILVFGGGLSIGLKLVPLYIDYNIITKVMNEIGTESGAALRTDADIRESLKKRFSMNNIRDFDIKKNISFDRAAEHAEMVLDYKVDLPLVANVDLLVSFHKEVELRN